MNVQVRLAVHPCNIEHGWSNPEAPDAFICIQSADVRVCMLVHIYKLYVSVTFMQPLSTIGYPIESHFIDCSVFDSN